MVLLAHTAVQFIAPDLWPTNNPNMNTVNYKVWGIMQKDVYCTSIFDVSNQKQRLTAAWSGLQQQVIYISEANGDKHAVGALAMQYVAM